MNGREYLLDVSRLIWRRWSGRLPTGIDRVCIEYVEHFGNRSQAVVQFKGRAFVLPAKVSDRLFALVCSESTDFKRRLITLFASASLQARQSPPRQGMLYLNVGHTGLDQVGLVSWIARYRVKAVYLIHDLIPITHPEYCRPGEAEKHRSRTRNMLASAAGLICNSEVTRAALREFAEASAMAMPSSVVAWLSSPRLEPPAAPGNPRESYFVALGTIEARKNHLLLLQVWRSLAREMGPHAPKLVIIGQRGWEAEEANAILDDPQELRDIVHELPRCDDDELARWLVGARALLMPSFVEGFGLPVIEALQLGVPVIASRLPVYREIVGDLPTYLDPSDSPAWAGMIKTFMTEGPERLRQIRELRHFQAPSWAVHFAQVERWLRRLDEPCATP